MQESSSSTFFCKVGICILRSSFRASLSPKELNLQVSLANDSDTVISENTIYSNKLPENISLSFGNLETLHNHMKEFSQNPENNSDMIRLEDSTRTLIVGWDKLLAGKKCHQLVKIPLKNINEPNLLNLAAEQLKSKIRQLGEQWKNSSAAGKINPNLVKNCLLLIVVEIWFKADLWVKILIVLLLWWLRDELPILTSLLQLDTQINQKNNNYSEFQERFNHIERNLRSLSKSFSNIHHQQLNKQQLSQPNKIMEKEKARLGIQHPRIDFKDIGLQEIKDPQNLYHKVVQNKVKIVKMTSDGYQEVLITFEVQGPIDVKIEAGTLLFPDGPIADQTQTLVVAQDVCTKITPEKSELKIKTFCFNGELSAPGKDKFYLGNIKSTWYKPGMDQTEVWGLKTGLILAAEEIEKKYQLQDQLSNARK